MKPVNWKEGNFQNQKAESGSVLNTNGFLCFFFLKEDLQHSISFKRY